jgi:exopolysaccharide biosynthesis polyprenyl glycosylphosphotransferase
MANRNSILIPLTVLTDAVATSVAIRLAFFLRFPEFGFARFVVYREVFLILLPVQLFFFWLFRMYDSDSNKNVPDIVLNAFMGTFSGSAAVIVLLFSHQLYSKNGLPEISRIALGLWWFFTFLMTAGWRTAVLSFLKRSGLFVTRVLLVGADDNSVGIVDEIETYSRTGHKVVGLVETNSPVSHSTAPLLGKIGSLAEIVARERIDEVILASADVPREEAVRMLLEAERADVKVRVLPSLYETLIGDFDLKEIGGVPLVEVPNKFLRGAYGYVKRFIDIVFALVGLILSLPVLAAVGLAVRLDSPGPILFRQTRIGKGKKAFTIYKFRSMTVHEEPEDRLTLAKEQDPRITRVGRFIRKRRLDELPQLINVLKGDMSLVGPRPALVGDAKELPGKIPLYDKRFLVRPGLTCLSHTLGRYDSTPEDRARFDLVYLKNASFFLDLRIILDTIRVVLTGKGAK